MLLFGMPKELTTGGVSLISFVGEDETSGNAYAGYDIKPLLFRREEYTRITLAYGTGNASATTPVEGWNENADGARKTLVKLPKAASLTLTATGYNEKGSVFRVTLLNLNTTGQIPKILKSLRFIPSPAMGRWVPCP